MSFHQFRRSFWPQGGLLNRMWSYHDRNPLSPRLNLKARNLLFRYRKMSMKRKAKRPEFIHGFDNSLQIAPRLEVVKTDLPGLLSKEAVLRRFQRVHALNERLPAKAELAHYFPAVD